jgi:MFS superfamily sulfate permease-like transporter
MLAAIGIILILKQIPHALGVDVDFMGDITFFQNDGENTFSEIFKSINFIDIKAAIISVLSLAVLLYWDKKVALKNKFFEFVPAPLIVVLGGVLLNELLFPKFFGVKLDGTHVVDLPLEGGVMSFIAELKLPNWQGLNQLAVYKVAVTLAIVASLETMLSVEAVDKIDPRKNITDKNREFIAQGIGNITAGLIGALPVTSVIVRSSANINSGARSKASAILHGFWLLIAVVFLSHALELIPLASLAAILIHVGYKLSQPSLYRRVAKLGAVQNIPFLVTIIAILFTDLLQGIFIGMIVGFIFVIRSSFKRSIIVVNEGPNYLIRFLKDVSFLNKPEMIEILSQIPKGSKVIIDGTNHVSVDDDVIMIIEDFMKAADEKQITFEILRSSFAINPFFKEVL